jgi:hypothetical protein
MSTTKDYMFYCQLSQERLRMANFRDKYRLIVLVAVCLLLLPAGVSAIGVLGSKYMESIAPGGTATHPMMVSIGPREDPTDIEVEVYGFGQRMDMGYSSLNPADDTSPYSARSFITLDKSSLHLEPNETKTINAQISVPANVGEGGRYAIIYIHALPGKGKSVTTGVLVPVMVTIAGTKLTETGSITDLSVGEVTLGQPVTVTTTFKNTGDHHYYGTVNKVSISDANGNVAGTFVSPPSVFAIIPGNTVQYTARPELQDLPIGTYTADSTVLLNDGKVLDQKTTTFSITKKYIPPVTESNITLTPGSAAVLKSPDGRIVISFPQGAIAGDVVVTLKPYAKDKLIAAPAKATLGGTSFEVAGIAGLLSKDATVQVTYSADDLAAAGGDASQLKLSYYDAAKSAWVILPTKVDTGTSTLTATTNHMGVWVVMVSSTSSAGPSTTYSPVPMTMILASLIIAVVIAVNRGGKRK